MINPDDYIITRKRKKYKFAKFANAKNCYEYEEWQKQSVDIIEIGGGTGLFLLDRAKANPLKQFVVLDVKADRLQYGAYQALARNISNISFVRARADQIDDMFASAATEEIWLTFPDPFPRARSVRRRLTHPIYLEKYDHLLANDGNLFLKHDNPEFFKWSLEQLVTNKWHIVALSFDLHETDLSETYKVLTTYETRWLDEGRKTQFVQAATNLKQ